ncbi:MAG TPA: type 1 glutamine amidotransferase [Candidatus Krumholzibacteria bacterium]
MHIHCLQHVSYEPAAGISTWAHARGHEFTVTRLFANEPLPELSTMDALVVMGGPMGVHDDALYPWMRGEKHVVAAALEAGKPVLGVCLGAQMIAHASGARVYRNRFQEIGWFPVEATDAGVEKMALPRSFDAFHWHGDTFQLPAGALQLARTGACENQMFAVSDRVLGIQFHLEVTPNEIAGMLAGSGDLPEGPYVQSAERMRDAAAACEASGRLLASVLDRWAKAGVE